MNKTARNRNPFAYPKFDNFDFAQQSMSFSLRLESLKEISDKSAELFEQQMKIIREELLQANPYQLLTDLSKCLLTTHDGVNKEWKEKDPVLQHHIELIQSMILKHKFEEFRCYRHDPTHLLNTVKDAARSFHQKRLRVIAEEAEESRRKRLLIFESMRLYTQAARNWGYPQYMHKILRDLVQALDDDLKAKFGISASRLVDLIFKLVKAAEQRLNGFENMNLDLLRARTKRELYDGFKRAWPMIVSDDYEGALCKDPSVSLDQFRIHLFIVAGQLLPMVLGFSVETVCKLLDGDENEQDVRNVLDRWSLELGQVTSPDEHLFMGSPIRKQPLIRVTVETESRYIAAIPSLPLSFCVPMIEQLFDTDKALKERYEKRRGDYLEETVARLFRTKFSDQQVFTGSLWKSPDGVVYENDCIAVIDSICIVAESKAGRINETAKRGGERLENKIQELLEEPAVQARRFVKLLTAGPVIMEFKTKRGVTNRIDLSGVKYVIPISVILDELTLKGTWRDLKESGLVDDSSPEVPTFLLADLMVIFDLLSPAQLSHYFLRRAQFEGTMEYNADELDLLILYLKTQFWFEAPSGSIYQAINDTAPIDKFYQQQYERIRCEKPQPPLSELWERLVQHLEETKGAMWTECAIALLNVPFPQQEAIEREIYKMAKRQRKLGEGYATYLHTDESRDVALLFVVRVGTNPPLSEIAESQFHDMEHLVAIELDARRSKLMLGAFSVHSKRTHSIRKAVMKEPELVNAAT